MTGTVSSWFCRKRYQNKETDKMPKLARWTSQVSPFMWRGKSLCSTIHEAGRHRRGPLRGNRRINARESHRRPSPDTARHLETSLRHVCLSSDEELGLWGSESADAGTAPDTVANSDVRVVQLEAALAEERRRSVQKDEELQKMQKLMAKLESHIEQQAKDSDQEQKRLSSLETVLQKREAGSEDSDKVKRLVIALAETKRLKETAEKTAIDEGERASRLERQISDMKKTDFFAADTQPVANSNNAEEELQRLREECAAEQQKREDAEVRERMQRAKMEQLETQYVKKASLLHITANLVFDLTQDDDDELKACTEAFSQLYLAWARFGTWHPYNLARPIVLSSTVAKVFTKALMLRLRVEVAKLRTISAHLVAPRNSAAPTKFYFQPPEEVDLRGPRDVREHVQAFMDSARPVAVIPSGTMLLTVVIGVSVLVLFGWGALTSFLRSLVTTMQGAVREHLAALLQDLNEQTKKSLLLEIGNATEEMQHSLTSRMEKTTEALTSQVNAIQTAVAKLGDAPRDGPNTTTFAEELWDSLRPVLTQWTQVQGDKNLKILQDWIDGAAQLPSTSSMSSQALEDKMKDFHAAVMAQLQDLQGAVTTTTLNKVDSLTTKVEAMTAKAETQAGYLREDHALIVRIRDRVDEVSKECLAHRSAVLAEFKNHSPIIRDTQKVATRAAEMAERTSVLLGKGDPSPWETELRNVCEDTAKTLLWVSGQETELKDRTHKIESMLTGLLDVVNDVGTALERHTETMGMRLRVLNDVQGGLDKVLATLATRTPLPTAPQQPPHFAQSTTTFGRRVPPAPTHTPTIVEDFSGRQPMVQTGQPSNAPPVLVTNLDALTQVLNQRSGF
ncbi:hypothetical protein AK812_SmicGene20838 [Symbiodinium microadriaticum]|uniref:Uncharacterized protein n=1 Tax=Symbiodinium microadriaticum TaxID=2951 RepID=A0A1Q9DP05_SYMMI|nr:hypothetical protein AK812_SmicGene20838 [Symbiodinium microadriaticum]